MQREPKFLQPVLLTPQLSQCLSDAKNAVVALEEAIRDDASRRAEEAERSPLGGGERVAAEVEEELKAAQDRIAALEGKLDDKRSVISKLEEERGADRRRLDEVGDAVGRAGIVSRSRTPRGNRSSSPRQTRKRATRDDDSEADSSQCRSRSRESGRGGRRSRTRPSGDRRTSPAGRRSERSRDRGREDRPRANRTGGPVEHAVALCIPFVMGICAAGDSCKSRHPDEENCRQALDSLQKKRCKFGRECRRKDCVFTHDESGADVENGAGDRRVRTRDAEVRFKSPVPTFVGIGRSDGGSSRGLPGDAMGDGAVGPRSTPCRYGMDCKRRDCHFRHPPGWRP